MKQSRMLDRFDHGAAAVWFRGPRWPGQRAGRWGRLRALVSQLARDRGARRKQAEGAAGSLFPSGQESDDAREL